jgi:hypothetical protein
MMKQGYTTIKNWGNRDIGKTCTDWKKWPLSGPQTGNKESTELMMNI